MTTRQATIDTRAGDIVAAHEATLGLPLAQPVADDAAMRSDPVGAAVLQAAAALGFIPADALCIARAWVRQTQRTGRFDATAWPDVPADFGVAPWPRPVTFAPCTQSLGLYAVMPDAAWTVRMARAGVPTVQLRFKSTDAKAIVREVKAAVDGVRDTAAQLFINDHWQAAIDAGAYGVHLGQEDLQAIGSAGLAAIRDAGLRLGLSSHGYAEMLTADAHSPSYLALGAVFPTTLKQMATPPQGLGRLHAYARLMGEYPLVAIGGIDAARLPDVLASGVGSVGMVRALLMADDPEPTVAALNAQIAAA